MANRYWVGGTGLWNATSTTNWAATSGGSGGASAPTSLDDVFLDANSGTGRVIYQDGSVCASLTCTGFAGTFESAGQLTVYGSVTFATTMTTTTGSGIILQGSGTNYIVSNGKIIDRLIINSSGTYAQSDALRCESVELIKGTYSTANYSLTCSTVSCSSSEAATINFGSSTVSSSIIFSTGASLTFNPGTSTVTGNSISTGSFARTFYNWTASSLNLTGDATFNNVTTTSGGAIFGGNMTVNDSMNFTPGTSIPSSIIWRSSVQGVQRTIYINALSGDPLYYFFSDIKITGSASPLSGGVFGDLGNNSGITFAAPVTYYWVGGSGTWGSTTAWATSSGGVPIASLFPLPQDSIVFDNNSGPSGMTVTCQSGSVYVNSITATSRTQTMTLSMSIFSGGSRRLFVQGDLQLSSACTLSANSPITLASIGISLNGRVLQNLNLSGVTSTIPFQFSNSGDGVKLLSNLTVTRTGSGNLTTAIQHTTGIVDTNGYAITVTGSTSYQVNGTTTTKTLALGATGTVITPRWSNTTRSLLTVTGTGAIKITSTFGAGDSNYYPNVECAGPNIAFSGSSTFGDITNSYKTTGAATITFSSGSVSKFENFSLAGEPTRICTLTSDSPPFRPVLVMSNGLPINAGSTSTNGGNNSGVLFTGTGAAGYLTVSNINSLASSNFLVMM